MDLGMGPSVGLVIFYEIFYEKSIFFFEEKTNSKMAMQYAGFAYFFCQNSPNFLQGARIYFFTKLLLLSQLARKMAAVQENMAGPVIMLFFSQHMPSSNG
ncbi:hypothetical protein [Desulfovibrio sp.]|uniref:hypothetical protein n=1 Tax=Desulfovibrio sp. TaxID=885 RepID=UPI003FF0797E